MSILNDVEFITFVSSAGEAEVFPDGSFSIDGNLSTDKKKFADIVICWTVEQGRSLHGWEEPPENVCDCGAKHTSSPHIHASWCSTEAQ